MCDKVEIVVSHDLFPRYLSFLYKMGYVICCIEKNSREYKIQLRVDYRFHDMIRTGLMGTISTTLIREPDMMHVTIADTTSRNEMYNFISQKSNR